jgi:hypothetical protein
MFQTLRARLIAICVAITVFSLLALALATFVVVRKDTLNGIDDRVASSPDPMPTNWRNGCERSNGSPAR